jgi:Mg2+-importing ATPase
MGTSVVSGSAICLVIKTGEQTYFSSISNTLKEKRPLTSFQMGVKHVTFLLIMFVLIMAPKIRLLTGENFLCGDFLSGFYCKCSVSTIHNI